MTGQGLFLVYGLGTVLKINPRSSPAESGLEVQLSEGPVCDTENGRIPWCPLRCDWQILYGEAGPRAQRAGFWTQFTTARGPGPQSWVYIPLASCSWQCWSGVDGPSMIKCGKRSHILPFSVWLQISPSSLTQLAKAESK